MLRRGTKRKAPEAEGDGDDLSYNRNLSNFRTLARKRESMRIKLQAVGGDGAAAPGGVGYLERALKERVAVEMALVEGTAKFIMACRNRNQVLEAAKTLLTARLRSDMLKFELNKLRRGRGSPGAAVPLVAGGQGGRPSYASLSLSDVRIPLMWRRRDHMDDVGDPRRFAVFVVARIGSQIYDSALMYPVDRHSTDITVDDVFLFNKVPSYFELTLEVYSRALDQELERGFSMEAVSATPRKIARSIGKAVGRTFSKSMKDCKDFENVGPKFELVGSATLNLDQCSEAVTTNDLYLEEPVSSGGGSIVDLSGGSGPASSHVIPLFGQFCCRLAALPYCCEEEVKSGPLWLVRRPAGKAREKTSAPSPSPTPPLQPVWASLSSWRLRLWTGKEQKDAARRPFDWAPVDRDTRIEDSEDGNALTLTSGDGRTWEFAFPEGEDGGGDKENLHGWLVQLIQHASDHRRWKQVAENRMEVYSPKASAKDDGRGGRSFKRTRSKLVLLYNQTE